METVSASKMSVNFYETQHHNVPEDSSVHGSRRENLKSQQRSESLPDGIRGCSNEVWTAGLLFSALRIKSERLRKWMIQFVHLMNLKMRTARVTNRTQFSCFSSPSTN